VRVTERRLEANAEEAAARQAKVPAVSVREPGLAVTSPDGNYEPKLRGAIQTDARFLLDDESHSTADSFLMRRVRPISEGTVATQFYYRVMPAFAGASVTLQQVSAVLVLTGEDANFKGIKPKANFDPVAGQWGAFELSTRHGELEIDDAAFAGNSNDKLGKALADPTKSARFAGTWGLRLNRHLNRNFKVNVNYDETRFHGGGGGTLSAPLDRDTERALLTRFQLPY
jgi:phosphate-selective porin